MIARTGFVPSLHGFPFPNWFTPGERVWGPVRYPGGGCCGGMVFATLDHFLAASPLPTREPDDLLPYLWRRLVSSWDLPFGAVRYYDWQRRDDADVRRLTAAEWLKVRGLLDAGVPAPLGLVQADGWSLRNLPCHHQILATGYELAGDTVKLACYDPNFPGDDGVTLIVDLAGGPVRGSHSDRVRGVFLTAYRRADPPHKY